MVKRGWKSEGVVENRKKANNRDEGFRASLPTFLPSATNVAVSYEKKGSRYGRDNLISAI